MAGQQPPGAVDSHKRNGNVKDGTSMLHYCFCPAAVGVRPGARLEVTRNVLCFDSDRLNHMFHSTAYSIAIARNIKVSPMTTNDKDSWGVKFFSTILPNWLHTREVDLPEAQQLEDEATKDAEQLGDIFWQELDERGVAGAQAYIEDLQAQRENAIEFTKQKFREAEIYNQGAEDRQKTFYHGLVAVKFSATIIVAGLSLPFVPAAAAGVGWASAGAASGWAAFGVGTSYSISLSLIKHWDEGDSAHLVLVAGDKGATKTGQKLVKNGSKFMQKIYQEEGKLTNQQEEFLAGKHWLQKRLAEGGTARKMAQAAKRLVGVESGVKAAQNAYRISQALKTVPYLFFAWSAKDAFKTAYDEW